MFKRVYSKNKLEELLRWYANVFLTDDYLYGNWEKLIIGRNDEGVYCRVQYFRSQKSKLHYSEKVYHILDLITLYGGFGQVDNNKIAAIADEWF